MFYFILAAVLCGADLIIKKYIKQKNATARYDRRLGCMTITYLKNKGAMLGFLKQSAKLLLCITLTAIGFIAGVLAMLTPRKGHFLLKSGLSLILGGACSNGFERLKDGEVTDYIRFNAGPKKFQNVVFNIGDFFIFSGCILTIIDALRKK